MFVAWEAAYAAGQIDALENAAVMSESERFLTDDASHDLCEGLGIAQNEISKELRRMAKEIGGKNL